MSIQVNLSIKEIYDVLCPKCRDAVARIVKDKADLEAIKRSLEGKPSDSDRRLDSVEEIKEV